MIEIAKDKKGDSFIITKTQKIAGINFHKQINISPEEMDDLYIWFTHHFIRIEPCTSLNEAILRLDLRQRDDNICGNITYTQFNGKLLSTEMNRHEIYERVFGKLEDNY